jgi:hypothetical protein
MAEENKGLFSNINTFFKRATDALDSTQGRLEAPLQKEFITAASQEEAQKKAVEDGAIKFYRGQSTKIDKGNDQRKLMYESSRMMLYYDYLSMDGYPILGAALDLLSEEATTTKSDNGQILNIYCSSDKVKKEFQPTAGLLNPPYKTKTEDIEEIEFILDNLNALRTGSKCVAVIPMSCAISLNANILELKKRILEKHTLEAVMSMPEDLFHNSKVGHTTCIIVITANKPHPKGKKTWLGYWRNDGFEKLKSKGRVDVNNNWSNIKDKWLQSYFNKEVIPGYSFLKELTLEDEWCVEAYLLADYNKIDSNYYKKFVQKYLAFRLLNDLVHLNTKIQNKNLKER